MKKTLLFGLALALVVSVAGCSTIGKALKGSSGTGSSATSIGDLPAATTLAIGTLKLEGSAQALSTQQATDLLPLWKAYRSLSQSSSASATETEALVKQIKATMTAEQVAAITALKLTNADVQTIMQEQGAALLAQGTGTSATPSADSAASRAARATGGTGGTAGQGGPGGAPGGMPAGGPSGGMPADAGGGVPGIGPNGSTTPQARSQTAGAGTNPMLINIVINLLQTKTGTQPDPAPALGQAPVAVQTPARGQAPVQGQAPAAAQTPTPGA
jgi:hypothetical protein